MHATATKFISFADTQSTLLSTTLPPHFLVCPPHSDLVLVNLILTSYEVQSVLGPLPCGLCHSPLPAGRPTFSSTVTFVSARENVLLADIGTAYLGIGTFNGRCKCAIAESELFKLILLNQSCRYHYIICEYPSICTCIYNSTKVSLKIGHLEV